MFLCFDTKTLLRIFDELARQDMLTTEYVYICPVFDIKDSIYWTKIWQHPFNRNEKTIKTRKLAAKLMKIVSLFFFLVLYNIVGFIYFFKFRSGRKKSVSANYTVIHSMK